MPTVYDCMEERLEPFVKELDEILSARLKGVSSFEEREIIFHEAITDVASDIEATLIEMLIEHVNNPK